MTSGASHVAALYDIHGNLPALEAVLAALDDMHDRAGEDPRSADIVIGGDMVPGPMPRETLDRLLALGDRALFIGGNCDRLVVDAIDGRALPRMPDEVRESMEWTAAQLDARHRDFLAALPPTQVMEVPGLGAVRFCHATPRSDEEIVTVLTPVERLREVLNGVRERVVVCGHTHMHFDRRVDDVRLVNAGSVGMPFGEPGAHWLRLGPDAEPVRTPYDAVRCAELVRATSYPQRSEFASRNVLAPPSEREMLRVFEPAP